MLNGSEASRLAGYQLSTNSSFAPRPHTLASGAVPTTRQQSRVISPHAAVAVSPKAGASRRSLETLAVRPNRAFLAAEPRRSHLRKVRLHPLVTEELSSEEP